MDRQTDTLRGGKTPIKVIPGTCFASTAGAQVNDFLAFNQKSTTNFAGDTVWTQLSETQRRHDLSQQVDNVNMFYVTSDTTHAKKAA